MKARLLKIFLYALAVIYAVIFFTPKTQIFYQIQRELVKSKILLAQEGAADLGLVFTLKNITPYYDGLPFGKIESARLFTGFFYNALFFGELKINEDVKDFFAADISSVRLSHYIFLPHIVFISARGDFGSLSGSADLVAGKISATLTPNAGFLLKQGANLQMFKKTKDGYLYEQSF